MHRQTPKASMVGAYCQCNDPAFRPMFHIQMPQENDDRSRLMARNKNSVMAWGTLKGHFPNFLVLGFFVSPLTPPTDIMRSFVSPVYILALVLSLPSLGLAAKLTHSTPTAKTLNGTYYGVHSTSYQQDFFFGIPFAQPPIGQLRYRAPEPLNSSWTGTRNATEIGYECIGYGVRFIFHFNGETSD